MAAMWLNMESRLRNQSVASRAPVSKLWYVYNITMACR
jgi:hypothetical protein